MIGTPRKLIVISFAVFLSLRPALLFSDKIVIQTTGDQRAFEQEALAPRAEMEEWPLGTDYACEVRRIMWHLTSQGITDSDSFSSPSETNDIRVEPTPKHRRFSLTPMSLKSGARATLYGQRLFPNVDNPEEVFRAWIQNTENFNSPSGSPVHIIQDDETMGRISAFYSGNLMLAIINQRRKKYGTGWVSLVRNYGSTVKSGLEVWENDPAFADFPWDRVIFTSGDNVIHGLDSETAAQTPGPADQLFVPFLKRMEHKGLKHTLLVSGNFRTIEAIMEFVVSHWIQRHIKKWALDQFPRENRSQLPRWVQTILMLLDFRIADHIQTYQLFIPKTIYEMTQGIEIEPEDKGLDLMHMGLAQGPNEETYYRLIHWAEKWPWLYPLLGRVTGFLGSSHIWFNERLFSSLDSGMRVVFLDPFTILVNRFKYKQHENFWWAITIGLGTTQHAARFNYVFANSKKGTIAHQAIFGPATRWIPASVHRLLAHKTVFFVSKDARMHFYTTRASA